MSDWMVKMISGKITEIRKDFPSSGHGKLQNVEVLLVWSTPVCRFPALIHVIAQRARTVTLQTLFVVSC